MRYKHARTALHNRQWAVFGTAALVMVTGAAMVAGRGVLSGDPPAATARPSASPTAPPLAEDAGSGDGPTPSPIPSTVSARSAARGTRFVPPAVPAAAPAATAGPGGGERVTARYTVTSTWNSGFIVRITVRNPTATAAQWRVVVAYPKATTVIVTRAWGATVTGPGHRLRVKGAPLAPGTSTSFRFQADKDKPGLLQPDTCTVNGAACTGV